MNWPLVTRKRFEKVLRRMKKYRAEVEHLQKIVLACEAHNVAQAEQQLGNLDPNKGPIQPIFGKPTYEMLIARANREAREKAMAGGSVVQELKEAAFKGRRDAKIG
jgi:hypothetical protein